MKISEKKTIQVIKPFHGLLWLCLGIFIGLALWDYDPPKSPLHTTQAIDYWENASSRLGYVGAYFSAYIFRYFGCMAWLIPAYLAWIGALHFAGFGYKLSYKKWIFCGLGLFFGINFFTWLEGYHFFRTDYAYLTGGAGGLLGNKTFTFLFKPYLGPWGSFLVLFPCNIFFITLAFVSPTRASQWTSKGSQWLLFNAFRILKNVFLKLPTLFRRTWEKFNFSFVENLKMWWKNRSLKRSLSLNPANSIPSTLADLDASKISMAINKGNFLPQKSASVKEIAVINSEDLSHNTDATRQNIKSEAFSEPETAAPASAQNSLMPTIIPVENVEKSDKKLVTEKTLDYVFPPLTLLQDPPPALTTTHTEDYYKTAQDLVEKLDEFGVEVKVEAIQSGPVITRYEVTPARGVRVEKIIALEKNIALGLKALSVRIQAPVPGKGCVGIEIPNKAPIPVCLRDILESRSWAESNAEIPIVLGKEVTGKPIVADLTKMPHLLIAGSTGAGKTVCINTIIASLLYHASPQDLRFIMVDPKIVEMKVYNDLPHMLIPVVTDPKRVPAALKWLIGEMERRYQQFAKIGARNIASFNAKTLKESPEAKKLPYIVCIVDELADLMMVAPADIETSIARLAQLARAAGIHLMIATQRPSVNVITGIIKANLPSRIAFKVASKVDSRTILDLGGADALIGKGDMLFVPPGASQLIRAQGALTLDEEINNLVEFLREKNGPPNFAEEVQTMLDRVEDGNDPDFQDEQWDDDLIPQALEVLKTSSRISTSLLQRRLKIGYNRAARMMETLEAKGLVPKEGRSYSAEDEN